MSKLRAFTMPKWGIEMTEGLIAEWMVTEGKPFKKGDVIALVETDKITNEIEAEEDAVFAKIVGEAGETYPVGALLGVLSGEGDVDPSAVDDFLKSFKPAGEAALAATSAPVSSPEPKASASAAAAPKN